MSKGKRNSKIKMVPVDSINILNPRVRNKKIFEEISDNIEQVGLKRPITVTPCQSGAAGKEYDLVCGQGRLEAFIAHEQKEIPAIIIDASEEDALVMSLVENLARRQHNAVDLLKGIEVLQQKGYSSKEIAAKTGLTHEYVSEIRKLIERGEERLISAVESGQMPLNLAVKIALSPGNEQHALQEAYENKQLRGKKLLQARKLVEARRRQGKGLRGPRKDGPRNRKGQELSARDIMKIYQKEVDRKKVLTRKAEMVSSHLIFSMEALRRLYNDDHFNTLLRAEDLTTLSQPIADLMKEKGIKHA